MPLQKRRRWNRNEIIIDNIFSYNTSLDIINEKEDLAPKSVKEYRRKNDWPKWKETIQT